MEKSFTKFLLGVVILLSGYGNQHDNFNVFSHDHFHSVDFFKRNADSTNPFFNYLGAETFVRKGCLLDTEETEDTVSSIRKQIVKSNFFLNFLSCNNYTFYFSDFTQRVNYNKNFSLLSNKVYLLIQVFRI